MWINNIRFAFLSLASNKMRSALTMLGILIGVFAVTVLMSISQGVRHEVSSQMEGLGSNVVLVFPGKLDDSVSGLSGGLFGTSTITNADLDWLRTSIEEIDSIDGITFLGGIASVRTIQASQSLLMSAGSEADNMLGRKLAFGRGISPADIQSSARVVVLDWLPAQTLFPEIVAEDILGNSIFIQQQQFEVIGIGAQTTDINSMFANFNPFDNRITIPLSTGQAIENTDRLNRLVIRFKSDYAVNLAIDHVKEELLMLHGGTEDFSILTQEELLKTFNSIFGILTNAIAGIAAISLVVGGIGIMNIMLVAVAERTKEIGIRKALGATDGNILFQFLIESTIIGLLGGLIGLGLSQLATIAITFGLEISSEITPQSILLAVGISLGAGIIFGVFPALNAARKNPVEALRHE